MEVDIKYKINFGALSKENLKNVLSPDPSIRSKASLDMFFASYFLQKLMHV